ncbi:MAG: serine/threonine-protein kinase [Sideroxydans sp.]|nr:serine/threonine-protein kinase [Sideroxydans sp.]
MTNISPTQMQNIGNYEIIRELGRGGTSTVYLALNPFNNRQVAIKQFNLDTLRDPALARSHRKQLQTEASLVGKLSHPHIVKVFDAVLNGDENYIVMEYMEGNSLEHYTDASRLLPFHTIAEIIYKCCKALEYAKQQGVIHRDIKPANILMSVQHDIKISDFGAAIVLSQQTSQIIGIGSPAFMSPEQISDQPLTHQTDIYSLGVTLYQLLTGKLPFDAGNHFSMIYQIMNSPLQAASRLRPEVPPELDAIVLRAMHRDRALRYPTWDAFANDLMSFFSNHVDEQTEIFDVEKFNIARGLQFFQKFSDVELWEVLRISEWRKVRSGEYILREGEQGRAFYILGQGSVKVLRQGLLLSTLNQGDCFGEMAHLSERAFTRTSDVVVDSNATLIEINPDVLERATVGCRFQINNAFLRLLVKRLDGANTRISHLLSSLS